MVPAQRLKGTFFYNRVSGQGHIRIYIYIYIHMYVYIYIYTYIYAAQAPMLLDKPATFKKCVDLGIPRHPIARVEITIVSKMLHE